MKRLFLVVVALHSWALLHAEIIAQWTFNSSEFPSFGQGSTTLIGGVTATFATGSTNDPGPGSNTGWNTAHYPTQGTENKTAGVQFNVSTLGYSGIIIRWDHKVSSSASKYCRLQYSEDGMTFQDMPFPICASVVSSTGSYYEPHTNDLAWLPGVDGNPNFTFRIVSEFESTALGFGTEGYVTTYGTNQYSRAGTIRLDALTISGTPIPGANTAPRISNVADQTVRVGQVSAPVAITVSDDEDAPENLFLSASSSDPAVLADGDISIEGGGPDRSLYINAGNQTGVSTITLTVTDSRGRSATTRFQVTVLPVNTAPFISSIPITNLVAGSELSALFTFTIGDIETDADEMVLSGASANPELVPNDPAHIVFSGSGSNRTVQITPLPGAVGVAPIIITVSDGEKTSATSFAVAVTPSPLVVLYEPFRYADGSLTTNSGFLWLNRSGTNGDCQVTGGQLQLSGERSEDLLGRLSGAPYTETNSIALYASFRMRFLSVPRSVPDYFAHFAGGSSLRGRVFAGASEAWPGAFRLYVANGSNTNRPHTAVLSTNASYMVVTRYEIATATTTLWVNPVSESDSGVTANDLQTRVAITSYGFRQDSGLGSTVLVDDLKVGLSFAAVMEDVVPGSRLEIERFGSQVVLHWTQPADVLQAASGLTGAFTNVIGANSPYTNKASGLTGFFRLVRSTGKL